MTQTPTPHVRSARARRGVTVLEAALVMPLLLGILFGTIEFAQVFFVRHSLQGAAREGARVGIVSDADNADVEAAVKKSLEAAGLGKSNYKVAIVDAKTGAAVNVKNVPAGGSVAVEVSASWSQFSVFLSGFGDWTRGELKAKTAMRREG